MRRFGVIENPWSQQNKKRKEPLEDAVRNDRDIAYARLDQFTDLPKVLKDFAEQGVELLVLSGGDGTVQGCLTLLSDKSPFERMPPIAILPDGMTNMTAADVGLRERGARGLRRLIDLREQGTIDRHLHERRLLRVENLKDSPPQVGMFFGAAAIYRAIEVCHRSIHSLRIEAEWANGLTLAILLLKWIWTGGRDETLFKGEPATFKMDGETIGDGSYLLFLATTLDRLVLGSRPFWNDSGRALRFTSIAYPPERLLRSAWRILYGGPERRLPSRSYMSCSGDRLEICFSGPFTLDGQSYEPDTSRPLSVTANLSAQFVRL